MCYFKISKIDHNPASGCIDCEYEFAYTGKPDKQSHMFTNADSLKLHISRAKQEFILTALGKFVQHKSILANTGGYYNTTARRNALDKCLAAVDYVKDKPLPAICHNIIKLRPHLVLILPSVCNPSYLSSCEIADAIHEFAVKNENENNLLTLD